MRFTSILAGLLALAATLPAQTVVSSSPIGGPIQPATPLAELKQYLTLTDSQVASLESIVQQQTNAQQSVYEQISQKSQTMQTLLQSASPNASEVGQLMIDIQNLQKQLTSNTDPYRTQALAILNQSQTALLANLNTALQLQTTAYEAVSVFLLKQPNSGGVVPVTCSSLGVPTICGSIGISTLVAPPPSGPVPVPAHR